jgi:hypothetical protein
LRSKAHQEKQQCFMLTPSHPAPHPFFSRLSFPPFPLQLMILMAFREMVTTTQRREVLSYWRLAGIHGMSWAYNGINAPAE